MTVQQISSSYFNRIIEYYTNILTEKFLFKPLTPVAQIGLIQMLEEAIREAQSRETHPAWHIPLVLKFDLPTQTFFIEPKNPETIEFI